MISYCTKEETARSLKAVIDSTDDITREVIVTDNNSNDGSADMIENEFPEVKLIRNRKNKYFAPAFNDMFSMAKGKYVAILNSDLYINKESVRHLVDYLDNHKECGIATCLIRTSGEDKYQQHVSNCWQKRKLLYLIKKLYPIRYIYDNQRKRHQRKHVLVNNSEIIEAEIVSDAFIIIRKDLLDELGGYSEGFKLYYTEDDLCIRVKEKEYKIILLKDVYVLHDKNRSSIKQNWFHISLIEMKDLSLYVKRYINFFAFLALIPFQVTHLFGIVLYTIVNKRYKVKT